MPDHHDDEHSCRRCNHCSLSVEALQARLAELDDAGVEGDASDGAWADYFEAVCRTVADVASLDLDAVTAIFEALLILDGAARAKGAAVWAARNEQPTLRVVEAQTAAR